MPVWEIAHVQNGVNSHILHMLKSTFSLDATQPSFTSAHLKSYHIVNYKLQIAFGD